MYFSCLDIIKLFVLCMFLFFKISLSPVAYLFDLKIIMFGNNNVECVCPGQSIHVLRRIGVKITFIKYCVGIGIFTRKIFSEKWKIVVTGARPWPLPDFFFTLLRVFRLSMERHSLPGLSHLFINGVLHETSFKNVLTDTVSYCFRRGDRLVGPHQKST